MRSVFFLCFLFTLPAIAALGHDFYLAGVPDPGRPAGFYFSDLGWVWVTYAKASHDWAAANLPTEVWATIVEMMLQKPAVLVGLVFAGVMYVIVIGTYLVSSVSGINQPKESSFIFKDPRNRSK